MKKFLILGVLAAIFFLVPSVQAQDWHGPRGRAHPGYHHRQAPGNHWGHQPPPRWEHDSYQHWRRPWHPERVRWDYHHPYAAWRYNNYRYR